MTIDSPIDAATRVNLPPLTLHVPEPRYRPGDEADFSDIGVLPAGATRRPDSAEDASGLRDLAYAVPPKEA